MMPILCTSVGNEKEKNSSNHEWYWSLLLHLHKIILKLFGEDVNWNGKWNVFVWMLFWIVRTFVRFVTAFVHQYFSSWRQLLCSWNYLGHTELCAFRIVHLKAVKISDVICIATLLRNIVSYFLAPKICLEKVILVDLIYPFLWNLFNFFSLEYSFCMEKI